METKNEYIRQFSIDIEDNGEVTEDMIVDALESAGIITWGCMWKATWTTDGYHNGNPPISND